MHGLAESIEESSLPSSASQRRVLTDRAQRWLLLLIFVVTATLQIALATRQSLWVDEIFSLAIATGHSLEQPAAAAKPELGDFVEFKQPVEARRLQQYTKHENPPASPGRVIRAVILSDTSPPLYYLLLYLWTLIFGTSDFVLRLFSIMWWLACFPLLARIARRVGGGTIVIPTCLFFALSPLGLYFSGEGRMYSLLLFCVVATAWASLALYQGRRSRTAYAAWILASAAGFLTHYFFVFPWVAMVTLLFLRRAKVTRLRMLLCIIIVGLAILPWYVLAFGAAGHWRVTQGWLNMHPFEFSRSRAIRNDFLQFFTGGTFAHWKFQRISSLATVGLFALLAGAFAWRFRFRIFTGTQFFLILWFVIVCAAPEVLDILQHSYFANVTRYTLAALPPAYLLTAVGLCSLPRRIACVVLVLIMTLWLVPISSLYRLRDRSGEPFRDIARQASTGVGSSDVILVHSIPSGVLGVARYCDATAPIVSWVEQLGTRRVPESLFSLAAGRTCIHFVKVHQLEELAPEEDWLRANATIFSQTHWDLAEVVDFRPRDSETF